MRDEFSPTSFVEPVEQSHQTSGRSIGRVDSDVQRRLDTIDWSFSTRERAPAVEAIHPYPAKFIGDLPRELLNCLPCRNNTVVFDPFVGSGTVLVEAQRRGLPSYGIDLNPIACLISRVKTRPTPSTLKSSARSIVHLAKMNKCPKIRNIPNVDHWFKPDVQIAVSALLDEIRKVDDRELLDSLNLALSSMLVRVSNQESDTRYAAVEKSASKTEVFENFVIAAEKLHGTLSARDWSLPSAEVVEGNTLTMDASSLKGRVGLVITSPPYPNAYEYWLYHKYRMWWLGFDPVNVKENEIGARAHFFKKNHHTEITFWEQMRSTFRLVDKVLIDEGHACFVIGRSKIHGKIVDNSKIIQTVGLEQGFSTVARIERIISSNRKSFNLSHANIKTETVLVLQKNQKNYG